MPCKCYHMQNPVIKKFLQHSIVALAAVFSIAIPVFSQYQQVSTAALSARIFPVSEIREGMRGTARSVFHGEKSEEFQVEILGVMPDWIGPKQDMIVGRLSGANAERTFVLAGMSGSPVYVDGRLVGAISYSFPFAKEPICGITPFEQMASVVEIAPQAARASSELKTFTYAELTANTWTPFLNPVNTTGIASGFL